MLGREKLVSQRICANGGDGEMYEKEEADNVMDAMERRIARLFNLVAGYQRNSLGLSAMYNRRLDSELERIAELESQLPKWISVKDRLPPKGQHVLVVRNHSLRSLYPIDVVCWSEDYITHDIVTHWMPLPLPPTTEDK